MPEQEGALDQADLKVTSEGEPSRRTFLKVSAVAGATVAAIAAGASVIPKIASAGAKAVPAKTEVEKTATGVTTTSSADPLILVVRGETVDVYRGETKIAMQDSSLARELSARVAAKIQ